MIVVLLHYSTVLSRLADQNTLLAQRVALLEQRLDQLDEDASGAAARPAAGSERARPSALDTPSRRRRTSVGTSAGIAATRSA